FEHKDVAETVHALRPGAACAANGRDDQFSTRPVIELTISDSRCASCDRTAVADLVIHGGKTVREEEFGNEPRVACTLIRTHMKSSRWPISTVEQCPAPGNDIHADGKVCRNLFVTKALERAPL